MTSMLHESTCHEVLHFLTGNFSTNISQLLHHRDKDIGLPHQKNNPPCTPMPMVTWKPMSAKLHVHAPLVVTRMSRPTTNNSERPFTRPFTNQFTTYDPPQPATTPGRITQPQRQLKAIIFQKQVLHP